MSAYSDKVLLDGARFYWRLGEAAGTTAVDQKGLLNATHIGGVTVGQAGALSGDSDQSALYGPSGAKTEAPPDSRHQSLGSAWTLEAWVYRTGAVAGDTCIATHSYVPGNLPFVFPVTTAANVTFSIFWGSWVDTPSAPLDLNAWVHLVGTNDGTNMRLYKNGVLVGSVAAPAVGAAPASAVFRIGGRFNTAASFPGRIDEVAIYPLVLTPTQILAHYNLSLGPYASAVMADAPLSYWRLGESAGTTAVDQKGILNGVYQNGVVLAQTGALAGDGDKSALFGSGFALTEVPADSRHQSLSNWTVEGWVYRTGAVTADAAIGGHPYMPGNMASVLGVHSTGELFAGFFVGGWKEAKDATPLALNAWTHVVGTYDGTTVRLYRNGVLAASAAQSGWAAAPANASFRIGGGWNSSTSFPGRIDEVALYGTALSPARVLAHYQLGIGAGTGVVPNLSGCKLWLDADDASTFSYSSGAVVSQWRDKSGMGNHVSQGTVANQPSRSGTQNGKATVSFVGAGKKLALIAPQERTVGDTYGLTIMAVFKKTGANNTYEAFPATLTYSNNPRPFDAYNTACQNPGGSWTWASDMRSATAWQQWAVEMSSPGATQAAGGSYLGRLFVNGVQSGANFVPATWAWSTLSQVLTIASRDDGATQFTGEIAEILVYDRKLSDAERQQVEAYLNTKWLAAGGQTVPVQGVQPAAGNVYHIVGQALAGQKVVGFITLGFGTPSIITGPTSRSATGLGSAGQFGTVTPKQVTYRTPPGLGSAQAFGTPTTVITRVPQTIAIPGKTSAQQFGAVTIKTSIKVPVQGVPTATDFGVGVHLKYNQKVPVNGIGPGVLYHFCGMYLCGQAYVGWTSLTGQAQFGKPKVGIWGVHPSVPIDWILLPTEEESLVLYPTDETDAVEEGEWIIRPTTEVPM